MVHVELSIPEAAQFLSYFILFTSSLRSYFGNLSPKTLLADF